MFGNTEKLDEIKESIKGLETKLNNGIAELSNEILDVKCEVCCCDCEEENEGRFITNADEALKRLSKIHLENYIRPNTIYVITGEFPNLQIDKKKFVTEDEFNYCLKEKNTKNIGLYPKSKCYTDFESAVNALVKILQDEYKKNNVIVS